MDSMGKPGQAGAGEGAGRPRASLLEIEKQGDWEGCTSAGREQHRSVPQTAIRPLDPRLCSAWQPTRAGKQAPCGCEQPALARVGWTRATVSNQPAPTGHAEAQILAAAEQIRLWHFAEWWGRPRRQDRRGWRMRKVLTTAMRHHSAGCRRLSALDVHQKSRVAFCRGKGQPFGDACGSRTPGLTIWDPRDASLSSGSPCPATPLLFLL